MEKYSDAMILEGLKHCGSVDGCIGCPFDQFGYICRKMLVKETERIFEGLTELRAERDAMKKELERMKKL